MRIWITKGLKDLINTDSERSVKFLEEREIKISFLREALPNDMIVLPFEDDYLDFLTEKKIRGLNNPVIFISKEPTMIQENLPSFNALLLDLKRAGKADIKNILSFLFRLYSEATRPGLPVLREMITEEPQRDKPDEAPDNIRRVVDYLLKEGVSIIVSFKISEYGFPVTIRGGCKIKEILDNRLLLTRFRPITILKGLKEGLSLQAVFPARTSYECTLDVIMLRGEDVLTTFPDKLFVERRRFVRIEPSPKRPVLLYILKHDEPTLSVYVTDISQRGIGFISSRDFNINEIYPFTIVLPESDNEFLESHNTFEGISIVASYGVIRFKRVEMGHQKEKDVTFRYGVELYINPKDEEIIAKYVMKRGLEIIQLLED